MNATEIKERIKELKENNQIGNILVRDHMLFLKQEFVDKLMLEQQETIRVAEARKLEIAERRNNAVFEIGKLEQQKRFNNKKLAELQHYKQIEQLKILIEKRNDLINDTKGAS